MKHLLRLVSFVLVSVAWPLAAGEYREFTDKSGRKVRAELVGVEGEKVTLRTDDGRKATLELSRLSAADQEYVRQHAGEIKASEKVIGTLDDAVAAIDEAVV